MPLSQSEGVRRLAAVIVVLLQAMGTAQSGIGDDIFGDAGSGMDAPDMEANALLITPGTYNATFRSANDTDWYRLRFNTTSIRCVELSASSTAFAAVVMKTDEKMVGGFVSTTDPFAGGLALKTEDGVRVGFKRLAESESGSGVLNHDVYGFTITRHLLSSMLNGDGGTGQDAGPNAGLALPLPGDCFAGRVDAANGDSWDYYSFTGQAGEFVQLSFETVAPESPRAARLWLRSPTGMYDGIDPGQVRYFQLDETGTWSMGVQNEGVATEYVVGFVDAIPPDCKPTCINQEA